MYSTKTTLATNIYNEEYLLPFWLNHHNDMFDDIIIVDYKSTDKSIEICKKYPKCRVITAKNKYFDAKKVDEEFMNLEDDIKGIKMVLNITEFLFCEKSIKEMFLDLSSISYGVKIISPYSKNFYNINNNLELFKNLLNSDVVFHHDRGVRQIHNFTNGNYTIGRHGTNNLNIVTNEMCIVWLGYYPLNDKLLNRKLQIKKNIPQKDREKGFGFQHFFTKEEMLFINNNKSNNGVSLKDINLSLYNKICHQIELKHL